MAKEKKSAPAPAAAKAPTPAKAAAKERADAALKEAEEVKKDAKGTKAKAEAAAKADKAKKLVEAHAADEANQKALQKSATDKAKAAGEVTALFDKLAETLAYDGKPHRRLVVALRLLGRAQEAADLFFKHGE